MAVPAVSDVSIWFLAPSALLGQSLRPSGFRSDVKHLLSFPRYVKHPFISALFTLRSFAWNVERRTARGDSEQNTPFNETGEETDVPP